jgi:hypothetical protein
MTLACQVLAGEGSMGGRHVSQAQESSIRLSFEGNEAVVRLDDTVVAREFASLLPLTLEFQDYAGKEKIAYLSNKLSSNESSGVTSGDFCYYAPWGNLAIFYNGNGRAGGGLVVLGAIESGKTALASMNQNFTMTIEQIN